METTTVGGWGLSNLDPSHLSTQNGLQAIISNLTFQIRSRKEILMQVQPYLNFDGRCEEAVEFYRKALALKSKC